MATTVQRELNTLTKDELYDLAQELDVEGRSKMDKSELIRALEARTNGSGQDDGSTQDSGNKDDGDGQAATSQSATTTRAMWRGAITFGLITIPIGLHTATEDRDISFRMLSKDDGSRIKFKRVNAETGKEVEWDDIVKGYEYEKGRYVVFTREELDQIPSESLRTIDVNQFAHAAEIDPIYFDKSYYAAPEPTAVKAYSLLAKAMEDAGRIGIGKVTLRNKERLAAIRPVDGVLVIDTMMWPDEIRVPDFEQLDKRPAPSERELEMAAQLIEQLTEEFDPHRYQDTYRERLEEAIEAKIAGEEVVLAPEAPEPSKVIDLLDALRASVEETRRRSA